MIDKTKKKLNPKVQWAKFIAVLVLYLLFLYWVKSWWGLLVVPFIFDIYITKKIKWQWWKESEGPVKFVMSWVDALVFALVAVYFINQFFFQNYVIPSSSLEKSLLTGDYLFVSKVSYGPRIPQTPLTMPLTQHTLPVIECKSYIDWPHWDYRRVKGLGNVKLNDIVVFNYPAGDTICTELPYQTEYYRLAYDYGQMLYTEKYGNPDFSTMSDTLIYDLYQKVYAMGSAYLRENGQGLKMGTISTRPTDRRENYVKRCVGLPGQTLQIKDHIVYLDGKANKEPDNVQYSYYVKLKQSIPEEVMQEYGISTEQLRDLNQFGTMPLTQTAKKGLESRTDIVESIRLNTDAPVGEVYPRNGNTGWTRDNYGPVWIPAKGKSIKLNMQNIAIYERPIRAYEGNELKVENGKIFINGKETDEYTFKLDYYWMMGDNRHNSADSRYWGFVPEDHIVGKPIFVWWSSDPDRSGFGGVRWNRLFRWVDKIK
ncbi:MAG: signal peptidase I [Prevotella sp.]|nr:signal peptidase I [Prevotella sp.]